MLETVLFFIKQKTAYEMRISDWSSDVCSSDLHGVPIRLGMVEERRLSGNTGIVDEDVDAREQRFGGGYAVRIRNIQRGDGADAAGRADLRRQRLQRLLPAGGRSEEHTSELQSLMRISYAVFCLKNKKTTSVS